MKKAGLSGFFHGRAGPSLPALRCYGAAMASPASQSRARAAQHDQYFTRPDVAAMALARLETILAGWPALPRPRYFIEPSAGEGAFIQALERRGHRAWAGDIAPAHPRVRRHDFLADPMPRWPARFDRRVVVGNPPFGRKAALAVAFLNRSLEIAPVVGFVLPIQFRKWSAQGRVDASAALLLDEDLPFDAFVFQGRPYRLRACFQVWSAHAPPGLRDLRLRQPPPTTHPDFVAWQYNCTPQALKYFQMDWDFAVLRQGFGDFGHLWLPGGQQRMSRKKQWIFIKARTPEALARLRGLDYQALSHKNSGIPGFGKADLVAAYQQAQAAEATRR